MGRLRDALTARALAPALALALVLAACASPREESVHVVQRGENLYRIALRYGVSVDELARANGIHDRSKLETGTRLVIPQPAANAVPALPESGLRAIAQGDAFEDGGLRFAWPVHGPVTSRFGWRRRRMHEGIDIAARSGTHVRASEDGHVIFASRLGGYGNVVVVRHGRTYETVYAHNRRFRVRKGHRVRKGDVIAEVGATGNASAPHLHFEIRRHDDPRDPLLFLP